MPDVPRLVEAGRKAYRHLSDDAAVDMYFELLDRIKKAFSAKDFQKLLHFCIGTLPLVERYAKWFQKLNSGNPVQVPAIWYACRLLPITGAKGQLENIRELVTFLPPISYYSESVNLAIESIETVKTIRSYLKDNPGTKQNQLKKAIGYNDGRYLSQLVKDMEHMGQLERRKSGNTYELYLQAKPVQQVSSKQPQKEKPRKVEDVSTTKAPPKKLFSWWKRS
ncbi:MAG: hypothetical protein GWP10_12335 [Nitrospiraceae bacterium]|nr:hypothetical protein [Nitrospiraceae bacterium]